MRTSSSDQTPLLSSLPLLLAKKYNAKQTISDLLLLQQQSDLIKQIQDSSKTRKNITLSTEVSELSFDLFDNSSTFNCSISGINSKQTNPKDLQYEDVEEALTEVQQCCSPKTCNIIMDYLRRRQEKREFEGQKLLEKERDFSSRLAKQNQKLSEENMQLKARIKGLEDELKANEQERKRKEKKMKANIQKQHRILKFEIGLAHKEKMHSQMKKRLNQQQKYLQQEEENNIQFKQYLHSQFNKINALDRVKECEGSCWRAEIVNQCRLNLNKERQLLQAQSELIEGHYLEIREIVEKLKTAIQ